MNKPVRSAVERFREQRHHRVRPPRNESQSAAETQATRHPSRNLLDEVPTVESELRALFADLVRGSRPSCVVHAMLAEGEPVTPTRLAAILGQDMERIVWVLDRLVAEGLALRLTENRREKYVLQAPYGEPENAPAGAVDPLFGHHAVDV